MSETAKKDQAQAAVAEAEKPKTPGVQLGKVQNANQKQVMRDIVQTVAENAFITQPGEELPLYPTESDDEGDRKPELDDDGIPIPKKSKKDKGRAGKKNENIDVQVLFSADPSKYFHNE